MSEDRHHGRQVHALGDLRGRDRRPLQRPRDSRSAKQTCPGLDSADGARLRARRASTAWKEYLGEARRGRRSSSPIHDHLRHAPGAALGIDDGSAAEAAAGRGILRGGPRQHRHRAAARAAVSAWSTRPAATPAPWPSSRSAPSCAQTRNITRGHDALRARQLARRSLPRRSCTGDELSDMTVGVIGYGAIGTRVVKLLKAFGCRILVCDPMCSSRPRTAATRCVQVSPGTPAGARSGRRHAARARHDQRPRA